MEIFKRTELLIGAENLQKLSQKKVIVFGVGGVGGYVCESLARSGIENITIVDFDKVSETNINRQIIALSSTINQFKVDVMKKRILDINPNCKVNIFKEKYCEENNDVFSLSNYDYVADCIDSVKDKINLIKTCKSQNINIISAMGAGNKFGIPNFVVKDLFKTTDDKLAKKLRKELRGHINSLEVVCAENSDDLSAMHSSLHSTEIGSIMFFPAMCGMVMGAKIIKTLVNL